MSKITVVVARVVLWTGVLSRTFAQQADVLPRPGNDDKEPLIGFFRFTHRDWHVRVVRSNGDTVFERISSRESLDLRRLPDCILLVAEGDAGIVVTFLQNVEHSLRIATFQGTLLSG